ncbi:MAG: hypothetical protein JWP44_4957 [Mucilaginibacter sp.]|nr:hypothetical protein [Mucilaginibacter sp.]
MKNNLQALRLEKGYKAKRHFAQLLDGMNEGNYGKMERGELPISANVRIVLENKFPEYNIDWIIEDKGVKFKKTFPKEINSHSLKSDKGFDGEHNPYQTNATENIKRVAIQNDNLNMYVVSLKASGGFLSGYENKVYDNSIQKISFPLVRGECFAFEIEGFSMAPEYNPGDWFVGSRLEGFDWLVKGRPYVFVTVGGIILKMFNGIVDDYANLSSINNDYNPVDPMHLKNIKGIFHKEAVIKL